MFKRNKANKKINVTFKNASGGWTIVKRTVLQSQTLPSLTVYKTYNVIFAFSKYDQNVVPTGTAMLDIINKMGFHHIHFYCHKKSVGRVVSIMTKNDTAGQQVVRYFTDDAFALTTFPDACGSYVQCRAVIWTKHWYILITKLQRNVWSWMLGWVDDVTHDTSKDS